MTEPRLIQDVSGLIDLSNLGAGSTLPFDEPTLIDDPQRLWPTHSGIHSELLSSSLSTSAAESWQGLVEELTTEASRTKDEALKSAMLAEAGRILIDWLGRRDEGELLLKSCDSTVVEVLGRARDSEAEPASLAHELAALEQTATDEQRSVEERAAAWVEFGLLCEERTPTRERALDAYRAALELVPDHAEALTLGAETAWLLGDEEFASQSFKELVRRTSSPEYRVARLLDLSDLAENVEERLIFLEQARQVRPNEETVLRRTSRALAQTGDLRELGELYREIATLAEDPVSSATALHLAFLTLLEAGVPVDDLLRDLASRSAERSDGTDGLAPLAEVALYVERHLTAGDDTKQLPESESVLERLAQALDDPRERGLVREQLAHLRLERLDAAWDDQHEHLQGLADKLEEDLRFCLVHLPEHRWVQQALAELLRRRGNLNGLAVHFEEWARTQSAGPGRASILLDLGQVHESRHDLARAAEVYELAVAEAPDNPNCLRALGRVYEEMAHWPQAIDCLRRQAQESEDTPERLASLRRVSQLAEHELGNLDLAIEALEDIARLDPDDLLALYQLVRLCRLGGKHGTLITALELLVDRVNDPVARTALLVELGEVQENHFRQPTRARTCYEQALRLSPGYTPALRSLARLYRNSGELDALLGLLDPSVDPMTDPAVLALKAGRVCFEEIGDPEAAIDHFRRAYETNPDLGPARTLLLQLFTVTGRLREAYDLLLAQDIPQSKPAAADHHYRLGLLAEASSRQSASLHASVPSRYENEALQHYRAALAHQASHGLAFERARRLLVSHQDRDNLSKLIGDVTSHLSAPAQVAMRVQLGRLHISRNDRGEARNAYEAGLALDPTDAIVRRELEGLLRLSGDRRSLPALYLQSARETDDTHLKATLLVEAAELLLSTDQAEDLKVAGEAILEALKVDPGNPYAVRHLERLLSEPDSPFVVKDAVSARAIRAQSDAERAIFYVESAELLERVGAWAQARRAYLAAQNALPNLAPADLGLQRTGSEQRQTSVAPTGRASIHVLLAEAREAAIRTANGDEAAYEHAVELLKELLERDPQHRDAIAIARSLATKPPTAARALKLLRNAFEHVAEPDLRYELGLFLGEHSETPADAVTMFKAASQSRPSGRRALRGLVNAYRRMGDDRLAATATEQLLELFEPGEPSAVDLRMGIANFLGSNTETLPRALEHARIVLDSRPNDTRALSLMVDLLERAEQRVEAAKLLDRLIARERDRDRLHDLFLRKAKLLADTSDTQETLRAVERAAALSPGNRETITLLVDQLSIAGQTAKVATYLPPVRSALAANVSRGAVSLRDLNLLAKVAAPHNPELASIAKALMAALDGNPEHSIPPTPAEPSRLSHLVADRDQRSTLFHDHEPIALHELLRLVDPTIARMPRDFPQLANTDQSPPPDAANSPELIGHALIIAGIVGVAPTRFASSASHNNLLVALEPSPTILIGSNLWEQGSLSSWRGLVSVAGARFLLGAPRSRALTSSYLDLLITACFESVGVFNPHTVDPAEPHRLEDLRSNLANSMPRRQKVQLEKICKSLVNHPFDAGVTAQAVMSTDLTFAALISGNYGDCLAAACDLDGMLGGSLKQRVSRSKLARTLLLRLISDDFIRARQRVCVT